MKGSSIVLLPIFASLILILYQNPICVGFGKSSSKYLYIRLHRFLLISLILSLIQKWNSAAPDSEGGREEAVTVCLLFFALFLRYNFLAS